MARRKGGGDMGGDMSGDAPCDLAKKRPRGDGRGHVLGNFPRYYDFHPCQERTRLLQRPDVAALLEELVKGVQDRAERGAAPALRYLDVGCNAGDLTVAMHDLLGAVGSAGGSGEGAERPVKRARGSVPHVVCTVGVDVDEALVDRATGLCATRAVAGCEFKVLDVAAATADGPAPGEGGGGPGIGRRWEGIPAAEGQGYDVISLFSVTMWIHLNHGDDGLRRTMRRLAAVAAPGALMLLEPQHWKNYRKAHQRVRRLGLPDFEFPPSRLGFGPDSIRGAVIGFAREAGWDPVLELEESKWKRQMVLLRRVGGEAGAGAT